MINGVKCYYNLSRWWQDKIIKYHKEIFADRYIKWFVHLVALQKTILIWLGPAEQYQLPEEKKTETDKKRDNTHHAHPRTTPIQRLLPPNKKPNCLSKWKECLERIKINLQAATTKIFIETKGHYKLETWNSCRKKHHPKKIETIYSSFALLFLND